jgi:uncharacterized membrane protein
MELDFTQFLDYGMSGMALAILAVLLYVFLTFMKFISETSKKHDQQQDEFMKTINANTKVTDETYQYLKLQNGSFKDLMRDVRDTVSNCPTNKRRK